MIRNVQSGLCRMNAGSYDQALAAFQAGLQLTPNDMLQTLKYNEITAYEYLGNYAQAKSSYGELHCSLSR